MKAIACTMLLLFAQASVIMGQCEISNVELTPIECSTDNTFSLDIDLTVTDPTAEQFLLLANGAALGTYNYSALPIRLEGFIGDCSTSYQFVVRDAANPGCSNTATLDPICCEVPCAISVTNETPKTCNPGGTISFPLDIEYQGILNPTTFTVYNTAAFATTYNYADLPVTIENFPVGTTPIIDYIICDDGSCCDTFSFINPCVCSILNTSGIVSNCSDADSTFFVEVDFDKGMTSDSFLMGFDVSLLGTFAYADLPVTVGPFPFSDNDIEFLVVDQVSSLCFSGVNVGVVDDCIFNCTIDNFVAEVSNSPTNSYDIDFSFDASPVTAGSTFAVTLDGIFLTNLPIDQDSYTIGNLPLDCDSTYLLGIIIDGASGCDATVLLDSLPCPECSITDFTAEAICDPIVELAYSFTNMNSSDSYNIGIGAESYGPFNYAASSNLDISSLIDGSYSISIVDAADSTCSASTTFDLNCTTESCQLLGYSYEFSGCQDQSFYILPALDHAGLVSDSFSITLNDTLISFHAYSDSAVSIGPLSLDCGLSYPIVFQDSQDPTCIIEGLLTDVPCCDIPCMWTEIDAISTCISSDSVQVEIFGESNQQDSALFHVVYDSLVIGTYSYSDLPFIVSFPITETQELTFIDEIDSSCLISLSLDFDCSDICSIEALVFEILNCQDSLFDVELDFESNNTQDSFVVIGNGFDYGTFSYTQLPILIEDLQSDLGIEYEFIVINTGNTCSGEVQVGEVTCLPNAISKTDADQVQIQQWGDQITIDMPWLTAQLSIYNVNGQLILHQDIIDGQRTSTTQYPSGLYLLSVRTDKTIITKKILIVK